MLTEQERQLLLAIQDGLPLVPRPYAEVANRMGVSEEQALKLIDSLVQRGAIKRIGAVPNPRALGIIANGMAVWDVPDERASEVGRRLGRMREVTHCYRRRRHPPAWPYNLFAMVHGRSRQEVQEIVTRISSELGIASRPHEILFSTRLLKKRGTRLTSPWQSAEELPQQG
jgi:DNA-binding Lrp family transcriptional regulator